jgi:peptidoglycan/LPS O-acetylase OafA/YrhL
MVEPVDEANAARGTRRNGGIDVLRGWAVLSVILLHLNIRIPFDGSALGRSLSKPLSRLLFFSGYWAVMVFFVISGFLITGMTEARWGALARVDVPAFYRIRFARIAPMLALFVVVQSFLQHTGVSGFSDPAPAASLAATIFSALTFRINWLEAKVGYLPGAWDVLWSLSVEELFYFGFPLLARVARPRFVLYAVLVGFAVAGPFARVSKSSNEMWQDHSYLSCMGEIAIGCLAAALARRHRPSKIGAGLLLFGGAGLMVLVLYFRHAVRSLRLYELGLDVTVLSCGTAAVLIALSTIPSWARATEHGALAPLRSLGRNSYELYLSHLFVVLPASLSWKRLGSSVAVPLFYGLVVLACALLAELIARSFSKPLSQRLRPAAHS